MPGIPQNRQTPPGKERSIATESRIDPHPGRRNAPTETSLANEATGILRQDLNDVAFYNKQRNGIVNVSNDEARFDPGRGSLPFFANHCDSPPLQPNNPPKETETGKLAISRRGKESPH